MNKYIWSFLTILGIFVLGFFVLFYLKANLMLVFLLGLIATFILKKAFKNPFNKYLIFIIVATIYFLGYKFLFADFNSWYFEFINGYPYGWICKGHICWDPA